MDSHGSAGGSKPILPIAILVAILVGGGLYIASRHTAANDANSNSTDPMVHSMDHGEMMHEVMLADGLYTVNTEASTIGWFGKKVTGSHMGTVPLTDGSFTVENGVPTGGTFTADLTRLVTSDSAMVTKHLQSKDFFEVETYPTATFKLTKAVKGSEINTWMLTGDMMIKGVTNPVTLPVTLSHEENNRLVGKSTFKLDRTLWKLTYGSQKFFASIGDKAIDDEFELSLNFELVPSAK